jgi:predicted permease
MLVMKIGLSQSEDERRQPPVVYPELVARAEAVPGVMSATLGADFAFGSGVWQKSVWVEGQPPEQSQNSGFNVIGPGFFSSVGIPVVLGREFTRQDSLGAPKVVMINDAFARRYFPGQSPVGRHLGDAGANSVRKFEVIGVVGNSRNMFLRETPGPMLYQPLLQDEQVSSVVLHVRARGNPKLLQERVRSQIREIDKRIPVYDVMTLSERVSLAMRRDRMMAVLASFFGSLALLLTVIGVYAVITYAVERRTTEIGVRRALGATEANVLWMVLRETLTLVVAGAALGIPLSFACTRVLKAMLYGVSPQDPTSLAWCIGVLITAGIAAGYLPARRAMRVDPMVALRYE